MKLELNFADLTPVTTRPSPSAIDAQRVWETTGVVPHAYVEAVVDGGFSTIEPIVLELTLPSAKPDPAR